jgi:hypothetical protein
MLAIRTKIHSSKHLLVIIIISNMTNPGWRALNVGIVGGGIGGLATATALRRQGHFVTIYERADFAGEVGASISCAANGTKWLEEWGVDIDLGDPVILRKLISRDWKTGEPASVYDLHGYKEKWGYVSLAVAIKISTQLTLHRSTTCFIDNTCMQCLWTVQ